MERSFLVFALTFSLAGFTIPPALGAENAGNEHYKRGLALDDKGEFDNAIVEFNRGHSARFPKCPGLQGPCAAWGKKGDYDRAMKDINKSLRIDPKFADAYTPVVLSGQTIVITTRPSPSSTTLFELIQSSLKPTGIVARLGEGKANTRRPSWTATRPFG